jgi:hypothetical protein
MVAIPSMSGKQVDYGPANQALADLLGVETRKFEKELVDGVQYSWHHHQDGKHMLLVPTSINIGSTVQHVGGTAIIDKDLKGFLPESQEVTFKFLGNCK